MGQRAMRSLDRSVEQKRKRRADVERPVAKKKLDNIRPCHADEETDKRASGTSGQAALVNLVSREERDCGKAGTAGVGVPL